MAKPATLQIKLISSADTGFFYVTKKNPRTKPEKLELMKYDPKVRKHVLFKESKIKWIKFYLQFDFSIISNFCNFALTIKSP